MSTGSEVVKILGSGSACRIFRRPEPGDPKDERKARIAVPLRMAIIIGASLALWALLIAALVVFVTG